MAKPVGLFAARKLRNKHRVDKYKKSSFKGHKTVKQKPLEGRAMGSGIVVSKVCLEAKQPNSAKRKCVVVQLTRNGNFKANIIV